MYQNCGNWWLWVQIYVVKTDFKVPVLVEPVIDQNYFKAPASRRVNTRPIQVLVHTVLHY